MLRCAHAHWLITYNAGRILKALNTSSLSTADVSVGATVMTSENAALSSLTSEIRLQTPVINVCRKKAMCTTKRYEGGGESGGDLSCLLWSRPRDRSRLLLVTTNHVTSCKSEPPPKQISRAFFGLRTLTSNGALRWCRLATNTSLALAIEHARTTVTLKLPTPSLVVTCLCCTVSDGAFKQ